MNPEDAIARQALIARLQGNPMPVASQMAPQAPVQAPTPLIPPQAPVPVGDKQLGDMTRKPSTSDTLAKNILPGTAHHDPHVQILSKVLLQKLIPYLGK